MMIVVMVVVPMMVPMDDASLGQRRRNHGGDGQDEQELTHEDLCSWLLAQRALRYLDTPDTLTTEAPYRSLHFPLAPETRTTHERF